MVILENLSAHAGPCLLANIQLEIPDDSHFVIMGKTGCGKTTLLEILCGLRHPDSGRIFIGGNDVTSLPPRSRGIGYVPQDSALFPGLTVAQQLEFPLKLQKMAKGERKTRTKQLATGLGVEHLLERSIAFLSGGEKQRVALGRALASKPKLLLLDEPLSALDEDVREEISHLIRSTRERQKMTVIHVTHSLQEAKSFTDMIFRMENGQINRISTTAFTP